MGTPMFDDPHLPPRSPPPPVGPKKEFRLKSKPKTKYKSVEILGTQSEASHRNKLPVSTITRHPDVLCGPLLKYKGLSGCQSTSIIWHGSVLIVTKGGNIFPKLNIVSRRLHQRCIAGIEMHMVDLKSTFWRFDIDVPLGDSEMSWNYTITGIPPSKFGIQDYIFVVPSASQSMRIMFHSCNGFAIGTDEEAWSGPALWHDVLRIHKEKPFHCMIGGGDQLNNDHVKTGEGPLKPWDSLEMTRKTTIVFDKTMEDLCDEFYYQSYLKWFRDGAFAEANSQIPQINVWDDHDIIDGFGSYQDDFMRCEVLHGISQIAYKYYCLFQHHDKPACSTPWVNPQATIQNSDRAESTSPPPRETTPSESDHIDRCLIIGNRPGPYLTQRSRSLFMHLGARVGFLGIDTRTERTRQRINYSDTYDMIFERLLEEVTSTRISKMTHLIVLTAAPIAYPRLSWLGTISRSPVIAARFFNQRFGIGGDLISDFDSQDKVIDNVDDLNTARSRKEERNELVEKLQKLSSDQSVRITIVSGDVHLAAVGRFYTKPELGIPVIHDHRYMVNIISSGITAQPPSRKIADLLAAKNKIHHLDDSTDETMVQMWDRDPGGIIRTSRSNLLTMPSRNFAIISESEYVEGSARSSDATLVPPTKDKKTAPISPPKKTSQNMPSTKVTCKSKDGFLALHDGEEKAGIFHRAERGLFRGEEDGALDVCFRVEKNNRNRDGETEGFGLTIPALKMRI